MGFVLGEALVFNQVELPTAQLNMCIIKQSSKMERSLDFVIGKQRDGGRTTKACQKREENETETLG